MAAPVAFKLLSAEKWDLDEPLLHYWTDPDVGGAPTSKLLTTRYISSQRSGFANWRYMNGSNTLDFKFSAR